MDRWLSPPAEIYHPSRIGLGCLAQPSKPPMSLKQTLSVVNNENKNCASECGSNTSFLTPQPSASGSIACENTEKNSWTTSLSCGSFGFSLQSRARKRKFRRAGLRNFKPRGRTKATLIVLPMRSQLSQDNRVQEILCE